MGTRRLERGCCVPTLPESGAGASPLPALSPEKQTEVCQPGGRSGPRSAQRGMAMAEPRGHLPAPWPQESTATEQGRHAGLRLETTGFGVARLS